MTDLQVFLTGLYGFICNFWFALIFLIASLIRLRRWEKSEEKRLAQAIKRDNLKREYHKEHIASRD